MDNRAIGVFDSGLGGLTAVRRLREIMPHERIIYFGDTGRVPYGTRSPETIVKYTRQDVKFLMGFDLKAIVVACNTATAVALDTVSADVPIPMIGVLAPACDKALQVTRGGRIGVIGTAATVRSGAYERRLHRARPDVVVQMQACPLFVPLVENGRVQRGDIVAETVVREYLEPLKNAGVDTLILGCTHYPLLGEVIADYMGPDVTLIDSGAEAANATRSQIIEGTGAGETEFYVSDDPAAFSAYAAMFLQGDVSGGAQKIDIADY